MSKRLTVGNKTLLPGVIVITPKIPSPGGES